MISPSSQEPQCDVLAQIAALRDPDHPKDAVWLARGTPVPAGCSGICHPVGVLLTENSRKIHDFLASPDDETLARILGYVEPKSGVSDPVVVQARIHGRVVTEMACSAHRIDESVAVARRHGKVHVVPLPIALLRRLDLLRVEAANAFV